MATASSEQAQKSESILSKDRLTSKIELDMLDVIRVSSKGQIVIPEDTRKKLHIRPGSRLVLIEKDGAILIKKEDVVSKKIIEQELDEKGWMIMAEESMKDAWDNAKDEKVWRQYL